MAKETMVETVVTAEGGEFNEEEVRAAVKAAIDAAQEVDKATERDVPQLRIRGVKKQTC